MRGHAAIGSLFGRLTVVGEKTIHRGRGAFPCRCVCGKEVTVVCSSLKSGKTRSCGCAAFGMKSPKRVHRLDEGVAVARAAVAQYRSRAARRGIEFALTDEQALWLMTRDCSYCGAPPLPTSRRKLRGSFARNGIDRFDNDAGYTPSNSVPCCRICNMAKNSLTFEQFASWVSRLADNLESINDDCRGPE